MPSPKTPPSLSDDALPEKIPFAHVTAALLDETTVVPAPYLYRLSDLTPEELTSLQRIWPTISVVRRRTLLEELHAFGEDDYLLDFNALGSMALADIDPIVRAHAVHILAEYEMVDMIPTFLQMVKNDPAAEVRAAAASALGTFVYLGEIEEISPKKLNRVVEGLLHVYQSSDDPLVRRRSLEALGFSGRPEIPALIEAAYTSGDRGWLLSALVAIGRSSSEEWDNKVLAMLEDKRPDIRTQAATAAGELSLRSAVPLLLGLLTDPDEAVRSAVIWALSETGGPGVRTRLEALQKVTADDDEADLIEEALENLAFTEDFERLDLLEASGEEELDEDIDVDDPDDEYDDLFFDAEDEEDDEDENDGDVGGDEDEEDLRPSR